jgi:dihydroxyacetone kinase
MVVQCKHFLNDPSSLVIDSLEGLCAVNPHLSLDVHNKVVYLASPERSQVALVCGGGSGHEPSHAGFVGDGILTAAVCGNIFASPNASQVRRGINLIDNKQGTVIIVKNYTGDVLNFALAKEHYAALHPDKAEQVKFVIVGDDVAVGRTQGNIVGRRGLAGTCLVYKIAGALARRGGSLNEVYNIAEWVSSKIATIGVGLEHCHVPGTAISESHLSNTEIEIGMGIHNESGHERLSPAPPLKELVPKLLKLLTSTNDPERSFVPFRGKDDNVVLLVNNLGGLSELELGGIVGQVRKDLDGMGIAVQRVLSGSFMTSLNMPGFSITLLLLPSRDDSLAPSSDLLLSLLDENTNAPGWKWSSKAPPPKAARTSTVSSSAAAEQMKRPSLLTFPDPKEFTAAIERACKNLIAAEPEITHMDSIAGDGDCGLTLKAGASAVLKQVAEGKIKGSDVVSAVITIAQVAEEEMGGTSGALYSIFFSALAQGLEACAGQASGVASEKIWTTALTSTLAKFYTYTRARPPSRTLVDPLVAFIESIKQGSFGSALKAAQEATEATKALEAKAGRSAYVGDTLKDKNIPDPGAWGVKIILESLQG